MNEAKNIFECLERLRKDVDSKNKKTILSFDEFLEIARNDSQRVLRDIFQLFHDMVKSHIIKKEDEYPDDPESIDYVEYDCSKLFEKGMDTPFFPDRLLINRFVRQTQRFKAGGAQNRMHAYLGPPGCGKTTFLNNLLQVFEEYTQTEDGQTFEIFWQIELKGNKLEVPCPSHDHPILIIPKSYRIDFLDKLLAGEPAEVRHKISNEKEYGWLFKGEACTICESIFSALCEECGSLDEVLKMVKVRPYQFNRGTGEGISIYNPGDKLLKEMRLSNEQIQKELDKIFGVHRIKYVFSELAKTNNGIYVLMDVKKDSPNEARLLELHNVVSDGVHKVDGIEERVRSLFFALMNPEDCKAIEAKEMESVEARIEYETISYVLEPVKEVKIYRSKCGNNIDSYFLPRVLENFAKVIISSRMTPTGESLKPWIPNIRQYSEKKFCDEYGILLRMEIYGGIIPTWLSEEDKKKFTAQIRRDLIAEGANEGISGFTGRQSIDYFKVFLDLYGPKSDKDSKFRLITMAKVVDYFRHRIGKDEKDKIPKNFINSLVDWYDWTVLNEVKEALYFYNKDQIREDILHYLCAINFDPPDGRKIKCQHTGKEIEVTIGFLKLVGGYITGEQMSEEEVLRHARDIQKKYTGIIAQDSSKAIIETELYQELFKAYTRNLKDKALQPFIGNDNFREAVKSFGTKDFETFDARTKEHIIFMIKNLGNKFGYTEQGAKEICLYTLERNLVKKFS